MTKNGTTKEGTKEGTKVNETCIYDDNPTSQDYLNEIMFNVKLNDLYKIISTCIYHQNQEYCPILVEVVDKKLQEMIAAKYLLQIWTLNGVKCYEKKLQYQTTSWNLFQDKFVFMMDRQEEDSEYLFIVDFTKNSAVIKLKNFVKDELSFDKFGVCDQTFFIANKNKIKIIKLDNQLSDGEEIVIEKQLDQIRTFKIDKHCKMHGFVQNNDAYKGNYLIVLVELLDGQIDFNRLYVDQNDIINGEIRFCQHTELIPRQIRNDPIQKFQMVYLKTDVQHGIALRSSGSIDIYWNHKLITSSNEKYLDVNVNFDKYWIQKEGEENIIEIENKWNTRVDMDVSKLSDISTNQFQTYIFTMINNHVKLFTSFAIINITLFVAHDNYVSLYDYIEEKWKETFYFDQKVINVFRNEKDEYYFNIGIYLGNNQVQLIDNDDISRSDGWNIKDTNQATKGQTLNFVSEQEHYRMTYVLTDDSGTINLFGFSRDTLFNLTSKVHDLKPITQIIPLYAYVDESQFILFNNDTGDLRVYQHQWVNNEQGIAEFVLKTAHQFKINDPDLIQKKVHTAFSTNSEENIFLVDSKNLYYFDPRTGDIDVEEDYNIQNLQFIDNGYLYTLQNKMFNKDEKNKLKNDDEKEIEESGFYVYDMVGYIENKSSKKKNGASGQENKLSYNNLYYSIGGQMNILDFSLDNQRLAFMSTYEQIAILPPLHRNCLNFIGMDARQSYLVATKINDKFICLDKKNVLTTWNMFSGKFLGKRELSGYDFSGYEIFQNDENDLSYKREWTQPKILIREIEPIQDFKEEDFYHSYFLKQTFEDNQPFTKQFGKTFHRFALIKIIDEQNIGVLEFIHPFYGKGQYQRLFFSTDNRYLLERLSDNRVYMYTYEKNSQKFNLIKRILDFPLDFSEFTFANYLFCSDLQQYLNYDEQLKRFVIMKTLENEEAEENPVKYVIPQGLMNSTEENIKEIVKRFRWSDKNQIVLLNKDGIEKKVSLQDDFEETEYAVVPLFETIKDYKHFYFHRKNRRLGDVFDRLMKKYQDCKSLYYIEKKQEKNQLYEELFNIDYNINNSKGKYVAEFSFTYLHWQIIDKASKGRLDLANVNYNQLKSLVLNILPGLNTVVHHIAPRFQQIKVLFEAAEKYNFEIPFIMNLKQKSPMNICFDNHLLQNIQFLFEKLATYPLDHHTRAVGKCIPEAVEKGITVMGYYLDKRLIQTKLIKKKLSKGDIATKKEVDYGLSTSCLWDDIPKIQNRLLKISNVEYAINVQLLDVLQLHSYKNPGSDKFFQALAETDDLNIFNYTSVRALVDYKYGRVKKYTETFMLYPFIIFLILYCIYTLYLLDKVWDYNKYKDDCVKWVPDDQSEEQYTCESIELTDAEERLFYLLSFIIPVFALYFLLMELSQSCKKGFSYLTDMWNYVDIAMNVFVITFVISVGILERNDPYLRALYDFASLLIWFKMLYFLRIYRQTGYLIGMIYSILGNIKIFILIFFLVIVAFAHGFYALSVASENHDEFVSGKFDMAILYSYRMTLGDFDTDTFEDSIQPESAYILFILCTLISSIVMLNLLIAIVMEIFENYNNNTFQASNQEKAKIVAENGYLIPKCISQDSKNEDKEYVIIAHEIENKQEDEEDEEEENPLLQKEEEGMDEIQKQKIMHKGLQNNFDSMESKMNVFEKNFKTLLQMVPPK